MHRSSIVAKDILFSWLFSDCIAHSDVFVTIVEKRLPMGSLFLLNKNVMQ